MSGVPSEVEIEQLEKEKERWENWVDRLIQSYGPDNDHIRSAQSILEATSKRLEFLKKRKMEEKREKWPSGQALR